MKHTSILFSNDNYERLKIGDWIAFDKKGFNYTGFISKMDFTNIEVFLVHTASKEARVHCGKKHIVEYSKVEFLPQADLSIEQLKEAIDISLIWRDREMFDSLVARLLLLQDKLKVLD